MDTHAERYGRRAIIGGAVLIIGAALLDAGRLTGQPLLGSLGNLLSALAGLGLAYLPLGLRATGVLPGSLLFRIGTVCWGVGTAIVSLVDLPAVVDPSNTVAGTAFGPAGLVLLSLGFLFWFGAIQRGQSLRGWRKWLFLLAGVWFFLSFPTIQLPLFVIPGGSPLFALLSGAYGLFQLLMGVVVRGRVDRLASARLNEQHYFA